MPVSPLRIAHRGMPRRERENTLPSFAAALSAGADGIELDVHATADGVVVVHHDAQVEGDVSIARTSWRELRRAADEARVEIPTLASVCALVGERAELFVEIKGAEIERQVVAVLNGHRGPSAIHSFDHAAIARLARLDRTPFVSACCSRIECRTSPRCSPRTAPGTPGHIYSVVDRPLVDAVHGAGGRVIAWTVNDRRDVARLSALGVDGLCTDDVTLVGGP